ncbi:MAG: 4-hydroxythreonine-4-phosphate dehydrogenase PdxA [Gammaproteobacteria bacterium]|nr:4-hydroxythreonine-4-phosphate dehydrogenase PdxA [Gammaproteobacteria bacterium]
MPLQIPRLFLTAGDPAGIGPELCLKIALEAWDAEIIVVADLKVLQQYAELLSLDIQFSLWSESDPSRIHQPGTLKVLQVTSIDTVVPGSLSMPNAHYVLETLIIATEQLLTNKGDALITGPVHKGIINEAGITFSGHTEFLANQSSVDQVVMMLACPTFRVALVTTHLPLRDVADAITANKLRSVLEILHADLKHKFNITEPIIHVCGLNPHAGEFGHMGMEEMEVIEPIINQLRNEGFKLEGPLPADTALTPAGLEGSDATLAMYHDQGLSVLKYAGFGEAVNITLGLPFIRVSVDHGTALDLAGTGRASSGSMKAAIKQAIEMLAN